MCWQCDHPHATLSDYFRTLIAEIQEHRWTVQHVEGEDWPFAYTIGLHDLGLPELLITGLQPRVAERLLNQIAHYIVDDGLRLQPARQIDMRDEIMPEADLLMEVVKVDHPEVHLKFAVALFGEPVRALQLVWTDDDRCWPWDRGWNNGRRRQPVFGVRSSWPPPNAGSTRRHRKRI